MITFYRNGFKWSMTMLVLVLFACTHASAQIWDGAGINIPGGWNGWQNLPANGSPVGSEVQVNGGVRLITTGTRRYHATVPANLTGTTQFVFISTDNDGNPWDDPGFNKWGSVDPVNLNQMQSYTFGDGEGNNKLNTVDGRYYTTNWQDQGYVNTNAVWMETNNSPVNITSTSQLPSTSNVTPSDNVVVTVNTSVALSPQEKVYIRYTTNSYATSSLVEANMVGNSGTAQIPAQVDGTSIQYYAFTSTATIVQIGTNYDMFTLEAGGGVAYTSTALPPVLVSFRVDMVNEVVSGSGVHIAGSFNSFNPGSTQLSLISGTVYGITLPLAQNSTIQYKFINGNSWGQDEAVPSACNVGGNREFTVGNGNVTIPVHCYASCVTCVPKVATTFRVNMSGLTVSGNGVHIAGDFGSNYPQWNPAGIPLTHQGGGIYGTTLMLVPGQVVPFKFINGNAWGNEEGVPGACNSGGNRSYTVPASASSTPLVCFGTCGTCITITLQVDMSGETVSPNGVHVAGAFQGWNPGSTPLTNIGGNIYARTVLVDPNQVSEYKFINGNSWGNDESVANVCSPGGNGNRNFTMGTSSRTLPVVCFRQCLSCTADMNWIGSNNNFSNGNNWTSGWAPSSGNRNVIIGNTANNPVISSGNFSVGNLTLGSGIQLTAASGSTLNIRGNLFGNNVVLNGSGTYNLNGSSAQTISGNILVDDGASNFVINNGAGVSIPSGSRIELHGALKLQNGTLNASSGRLILGSDESGQGRLLKVETGASLVGNITYEKYLTGLPTTQTGAWYFVTPTISGFTLGGYDQGGNNFNPATFQPTHGDPASLYTYSPLTGGYDEFGWAKASSPGQAISNGQGIRVWARRGISNNQFVYTGDPVLGDVNFPLSYCASGCSYPSNGSANGWNFLGNSYPCTIDWNAPSGWTKTGIDGNAIFVWNGASNSYSTFNGTIGLNGGSRYIAGGQAFFVNATSGASTLGMSEDVKSDQNTSGMRVATQEISGLKISAIAGPARDEIFLDMTPGHETTSAPKLDNPGLTLSFSTPRYSIAAPGLVSQEGNIQLKLLRVPNQFKFELEKMGPEWAFTELYLKDNVNGLLFPVNENLSSFNFFATGSDTDRFSLVIANSTTSSKGKISSGLAVYPNPSSGKVSLRNADNLKGSYSVSDLSGKIISTGKLSGAEQTLNFENLPAGQYLIRFTESPEVIRFSRL